MPDNLYVNVLFSVGHAQFGDREVNESWYTTSTYIPKGQRYWYVTSTYISKGQRYWYAQSTVTFSSNKPPR